MSSTLQEREVQRYYQPWLAAHGSSLNVANHVDSLALWDLQKQGYQPKTSRDKAITAFAQIVALRLNVRRCMVSLIDAANQYILAEATQTHSATNDAGSRGDELWLGSAILSRADAVCEHTFINTCSAPEGDGKFYHTKGLIINDMRLDDRFKDRPYVVQEPGVRFYAGVPLYSRSGYMIGAIAVSDDEPREGLVADELRLMQETAQGVLEHLEWARDRVDRFKGERIVRGMASFIEDCGSIRDDPRQDESGDKSGTSERSTSAERTTLRSSPNPKLSSRPPLMSKSSAKRVQSKQRAVSKADGMSRMFATAAEILRESTLADGCALFGATADSGRTPNIRATPHNLDGVTEKSAGTVYGQPSPESSSEAGGHDTNTSDSDSSPASRPCRILSFAVADEQARRDIESGTALTLATLEKYFALHPHGKTFSFNEEGSGISSEEESDAVASATEAEHAADSSEEARTLTARARARKRRMMDHKELLKKIPGAKTVIFLPLYDHAEEKLIAGAFLWTSVTGRMLQDFDLSYLRAFGNCIVSELIRMNMQRNEAAKTTFIASMSHELRSPLHGILGAAEFLMDTATDSYQSGLVTSIVTCGRTLLDTLNHVLDYSKINKLGRTQMRKRAKQNKPVNLASDSTLESLNLTADVDLGILVEEVAEAVNAGHTFKHLPDLSIARRSESSNSSNDNSTGDLTGTDNHGQTPSRVTVLLDISPRKSWLVRIQPGALRRIIMNLLGNALKYTSSGFVAVSLRAQESTDNSKTKALIRVVDSGKGMSESFQRDRLFVPFSQEDPFQPGTGLGLSIVKQIVDSLGGHIEVRSELGVGTEVDVTLSLPPATGAAASRPSSKEKPASDRTSRDSHEDPGVFDREMIEIEQKTRGRHLVLLNPADPHVALSLTSANSRFQQTLGEIATSWFGMHVTYSTDMNVQGADMYIFCEPPPVEQLRDRNRKTVDNVAGALDKDVDREVPIIIVCMNDQDALNMTRNHQSTLRELGRIVEVIPQPCGPRKLAKALMHSLRRKEELSHGNGRAGALDTYDNAKPDEGVRHNHNHVGSTQRPSNGHRNNTDDLRNSMSAAVSYPALSPFNPNTPSLQSPAEQPGKDLHKNTDDDSTPKASNLNSKDPMESGARAPHLLLVDDNKINRQLLVMFMKKCEYTYREAENGQEALDEYQNNLERSTTDTSADIEMTDDGIQETGIAQNRKHSSCNNTITASSRSKPAPFDFVLMDISMPIMDGMEATRRIREFEKEQGLKKTVVIALTGLASEGAREEAETVGIDVFLPKPVKFKELRSLLEMRSRGEIKATVA